MKILFVDSCPRGESSRTLALSQCFLEAVQERLEGTEVIVHHLEKMHLQSMDTQLLDVKERLCDMKDWSDSFFRYAVQFAEADAVIVAAPYWDLSFPSVLKVWVENIYVRNLTFRYEADRCIGLAKGKVCCYVTTSGSPIGNNDWGSLYLRAVLQALGIPEFRTLKAEGLDLDSNDPLAILEDARRGIPELADEFVRCMMEK